MLRFNRAFIWYCVFTVVAALCCAIAMIFAGGLSSSYGIIATIFLTGAFAVRIAACAVMLFPALWLATGGVRGSSLTTTALGILFALIALRIGQAGGGGIEDAARDFFIPVAIIGAISGWLADWASWSWVRSSAPVPTGGGFFAFLKPSGEPT